MCSGVLLLRHRMQHHTHARTKGGPCPRLFDQRLGSCVCQWLHRMQRNHRQHTDEACRATITTTPTCPYALGHAQIAGHCIPSLTASSEHPGYPPTPTTMSTFCLHRMHPQDHQQHRPRHRAFGGRSRAVVWYQCRNTAGLGCRVQHPPCQTDICGLSVRLTVVAERAIANMHV